MRNKVMHRGADKTLDCTGLRSVFAEESGIEKMQNVHRENVIVDKPLRKITKPWNDRHPVRMESQAGQYD